MYRVIVVDDEPLIRERICQKMDWESIGYELAGKFEHGRAAKEFLEQNAVDVVLTDICMPYMDGIALSEYIYKNMPQVKVIIFSGFDDFEYAQKAIHYQVEEYLLKPVTAEDLSKLLIKQKMKMDEERKARENSRKLSRTLHKNKIYLYSQALQKLFCGSSPAQECIRELKECGIELFGTSFYPVILRLNESGRQSALFQFVAYNIVQELVQKRGLGWAGLGYECDIFICFCNKGFGGEEFTREVRSCLSDISATLRTTMQVEFVISVGICVSSLEEISASCRRAMEHFRHCHTADEDSILWENSAGDDGARGRTVMLAMEYLLLNYGRPELTLTEVCQHFGVSVTRFSANFKQQYGETFVEALSRIRMEEAKKLLRTTNLKNYEIAERVGFADPHYFSVAFKKATGKSPTEWGRAHERS